MTTLLPSQQMAMDAVTDALEFARREFILWYGGVRSGKSRGAVECFIQHAKAFEGTKPQYILGGVSLRAIINNIAPHFRDACEEHGLNIRVVEGGQNPRIEVGEDARFLIYGGDSKGRDKVLKGLTARGLLLDEYDTLEQRFINQCEARISLPSALRIYTANKENPYSWTTQAYYERAKEGLIDAVVIDDDPKSNTFIDPEYYEERIREYDDATRRRFIENEFTLDFPPLYEFDRDGELAEVADIVVISSQGTIVSQLPFYKHESHAVIGEIMRSAAPLKLSEVIPAERGYLINASLPMIAKDLRDMGNAVRGYSAMQSLQGTVERIQRLADMGVIKLYHGVKMMRACVDQYFDPQMRGEGIIELEMGIEMLRRLERWE